jgi:hypothetical protein
MLKNNGFHNRHSPFSRPFSPASFFANGEQGWWYDPSNFSTLFQDSAGTTPVTAVEQPVGLQLDLSKGLVLGPELVTNGDFSNGTTGWIIASGGTAAVTSGVIRLTSTTGRSTASQAILTNVGQQYRIDLGLVSNGTAGVGSAIVRVTSTNSYSGTVVASAGSASSNGFLFFTATTATTYIWLAENSATSGVYVEFGGLSVNSDSGNHRFQTTSANRPVVSARVNLLTKTEQFDNASWTKQSGTTVSSTPVAAPDGSLTAFTVSGNGTSGIFQAVAGSTSLGQTIRAVYLRVTTGTATVGIKDPVTTQGTTTCSLTTTWQRFTLTETTTPTGGFAAGIWIFNIPSTGIEIAWPDVRPTNQGVNLPAYQRVNTSTDYDSTGFPVYIKPNGSNQFMQTNSINFTATDKMTVWQGVRKLSDAADAIAVELGNNSAGAFYIAAPDTPAYSYAFAGRGSASAAAGQTAFTTLASFPAPTTNVLSAAGNISGDLNTIRVNGSAGTSGTSDQGTGNYGNYPAYFYARAGTSIFFNGNDYGSIARGAASTAAQIANGETYINKLTKAFA